MDLRLEPLTICVTKRQNQNDHHLNISYRYTREVWDRVHSALNSAFVNGDRLPKVEMVERALVKTTSSRNGQFVCSPILAKWRLWMEQNAHYIRGAQTDVQKGATDQTRSNSLY